MEYRVHQLAVRRDTAQALEEAGYIAVNKTFVERKPRTFVAATAAVRKVFQQHVAARESILKSK
jgi:hypothetical protein